jgi:energy-converting hydrogenase Eha subunit B
MAADDNDNNVDGNGTTGNKVNDDGNGTTGRLLLMFLGTIVSSTRTSTGNLICALFYYAVIVMNGSPSL